MTTLNTVVGPDQLFWVLGRSGQRQIVVAEDEADLPVNPAELVFAASLSELEAVVAEMRKVLAVGIDEDAAGDICFHELSKGA